MNMYDPARLKALLKKYKNGECSADEQALVEAWLTQPSRQAHTLPDKEQEDAIVKAIRQQVLKQTKPAAKRVRLLTFARVAAALLIIPCAYLLYMALGKKAQPADEHFFTARGERKTLILPDSTEVTLNASSKLSVSPGFNDKYRRVSLIGEAYFRVKHDKSRPFIITTAKIETKVLGTEFNVHAYPAEELIKVAVVQGRVKVSKPEAGKMQQMGRVLTHNLMLSYNTKTGKHSIKTADADKLCAWQHGFLYFEDATIQEITQSLSRHYNTSIELVDKPRAGCRYTIGFSGEKLPKVLTVLGQLTGITYQQTQNKITIHSKQCQ